MHCSRKIQYPHEEAALLAIKEVRMRNRRANGFLRKYGIQLNRSDDRLSAHLCKRCKCWHTGNSRFPLAGVESIRRMVSSIEGAA